MRSGLGYRCRRGQAGDPDGSVIVEIEEYRAFAPAGDIDVFHFFVVLQINEPVEAFPIGHDQVVEEILIPGYILPELFCIAVLGIDEGLALFEIRESGAVFKKQAQFASLPVVGAFAITVSAGIPTAIAKHIIFFQALVKFIKNFGEAIVIHEVKHGRPDLHRVGDLDIKGGKIIDEMKILYSFQG